MLHVPGSTSKTERQSSLRSAQICLSDDQHSMDCQLVLFNPPAFVFFATEIFCSRKERGGGERVKEEETGSRKEERQTYRQTDRKTGRQTGRQTGRELLFVGCLTSQQHACVSQKRICSDNFMCCHTETEVADPTFYLTQSQNIDTGPTSPSTDPITPGAWKGSRWSANF